MTDVNALQNKKIEANIPLSKEDQAKKTQKMFFNLLATQLKYQSPDNPVDSNQMVQNIYQMNELQTLISIDTKMDKMVDNLNQFNAVQSATSIVGKYAVSENNELNVDDEQKILPFNFLIDGTTEKADNVTVRIRNSKHELIHEEHLQNIPTNKMQTFDWNTQNNGNPVKPGTYTVSIIARDDEDNIMHANIYTSSKIHQGFMDGTFSTGSKIIDAKSIIALQDMIHPLSIMPDSYQKNGKNSGSVRSKLSDIISKI